MSVLSHPRAVSGRVFANQSPQQIIAALNSGFENFKAKHEGDQAEFQKALDEVNFKLAALGLGALPSAAGDIAIPPDPEYTKVFGSWFRDNTGEVELKALNKEGFRKEIHAAMSGGSATDGGYLAPVEWDRKVLKKLSTISPMRKISTIVTTTVRGYQTVWNGGSWGSGWVGETAARTATTTPTLSPLTFSAGELYAMPAITSQLLDDAEFDVADWLSNELSDEFAKQEGIAFISGDGTNKPQGLLTYVTGGSAASLHPAGAITVLPSGDAATVKLDYLFDMVYKLPAAYRQGASWLMNSLTMSAVRKIKDIGGNYIWATSVADGEPDKLLGYPVAIDDNLPDIAANAIPIVFGNFQRGYVINDRQGVRVLRDPYTNKPYVNFYTTRRVGGGVRDPNAFRAMKISAS